MPASAPPLALALAAGLALVGLAPGGPALAQPAPQSRPATAPQTPAQPPAAQTPAAQTPAAQPPASTRTEIVTHENWTVTCRDPVAPQTKRACSAVLQVFQETQGGQRNLILAWVVGLNAENRLMSVWQTPTGVAVDRGVEIVFGQRPPIKAPYTICEPQRCEAAVAMDDAFLRAGGASETADAVIVASNGQTIRVSMPIRGFERAVAMVRQ